MHNLSMLRNSPIFVSIHALYSMMCLPASDRTSQLPIEGSTMNYVRTFTFKSHEVVNSLQLLFDEYQGGHFPDQLAVIWSLESSHWEEGSKDMPIYLRSNGQTRKTGWRRYTEDLAHDNAISGLNRCFPQICRTHFPTVLSEAEIHKFASARIGIPLKPSRSRIADAREQVLMALSGSTTLFNSCRGGLLLWVQNVISFISTGTISLRGY